MTALFGRTIPAWLPLADVCETDKDFQLVLDVPGVPLDKLCVTGERNRLTISGNRDAFGGAKEKGLGDVMLKERREGRFSRSFVLPATAQVDQAEAELADGLLRVTIPKTSAARRHDVAITHVPATSETQATTAPAATKDPWLVPGGRRRQFALPAPELQAISAKIISVLRRLRQLQRQGGYSLNDVTQLQDELREIEMSRREDGTFGGRPGFEGTSAREALIARLLYRAHRVASSFVSAAEVDPALEPVQRELGDIEAALNDMLAESPGGHAHDDALRKLQERLDAIDARRKDAAFPSAKQGEAPLHGQAFLHNLLDRCYDLVSQLQDPSSRAGDIDPQLRHLHTLLRKKVELLEDMCRRGTATAKELHALHDSLIELERQRVAGVFGGTPAVPVPKGQAAVSSLLHRAYRLLHILEVKCDAAASVQQ